MDTFLRRTLALGLALFTFAACDDVQQPVEPEVLAPQFSLSGSEWDQIEDYLEDALLGAGSMDAHAGQAVTAYDFGDLDDSTLRSVLGNIETKAGHVYNNIWSAEFYASTEDFDNLSSILVTTFANLEQLAGYVDTALGEIEDGFDGGWPSPHNYTYADIADTVGLAQTDAGSAESNASIAESYVNAGNEAAAATYALITAHYWWEGGGTDEGVHAHLANARSLLIEEGELGSTPDKIIVQLSSLAGWVSGDTSVHGGTLHAVAEALDIMDNN